MLRAVDGEEAQRAVGVAHGQGVQHRLIAQLFRGKRVAAAGAGIYRAPGAVAQQLEHGVGAVGVGAPVVCQDESQVVDNQRLAGDLHPVGMAQKRQEHARKHHHILKGEGDAVAHGAHGPFAQVAVGHHGAHVPLVKADADLLVRPLAGGYIVAHADHRFDHAVHVRGHAEVIGRGQAGFGNVLVQGDVVHLIKALHQHLAVPFGVVVQMGGAGADAGQLQRGIHLVHQLPGLLCQAAVLLGALVAHLPFAVQLVAQAPQPDAEGLLRAVAPAHVGKLRALGEIAVFQHVRSLQRAAGTQVDRHHGFGVKRLFPLEKVVQAKLVGFHLPPGQVEGGGAVGADGVLPAVGAGIIAPGIAQGAQVQRLQQRQHILPEAPFVRGGVPGLINAVVNHRAHVFHKGAEKAGVCFTRDKRRMNRCGIGFHHQILLADGKLQSFMPLMAMPAMKYFCAKQYISSSGIMEMTDPAMLGPYWVTRSPTNMARPLGRVRISVVVVSIRG